MKISTKHWGKFVCIFIFGVPNSCCNWRNLCFVIRCSLLFECGLLWYLHLTDSYNYAFCAHKALCPRHTNVQNYLILRALKIGKMVIARLIWLILISLWMLKFLSYHSEIHLRFTLVIPSADMNFVIYGCGAQICGMISQIDDYVTQIGLFVSLLGLYLLSPVIWSEQNRSEQDQNILARMILCI